LTLLAWRHTYEEREFIRAWTERQGIPDELRRAAALFHAATYVQWDRARYFFCHLAEFQIQPQPTPGSIDDPQARQIQSQLWAFLQAGKQVLDSLAREVNLIYFLLDEHGRFFNPMGKPRWISFYTVRQKLLADDPVPGHPVSRVLKRRTFEETADPAYRTLSLLAHVSLIVPLIVGPIIPQAESSSSRLKLGQCRVLLPDDPREEKLTYTEGLEVNQTGQQILDWLEQFLDEMYMALVASLSRLGGGLDS
jgi:hypothetical protein